MRNSTKEIVSFTYKPISVTQGYVCPLSSLLEFASNLIYANETWQENLGIWVLLNRDSQCIDVLDKYSRATPVAAVIYKHSLKQTLCPFLNCILFSIQEIKQFSLSLLSNAIWNNPMDSLQKYTFNILFLCKLQATYCFLLILHWDIRDASLKIQLWVEVNQI